MGGGVKRKRLATDQDVTEEMWEIARKREPIFHDLVTCDRNVVNFEVMLHDAATKLGVSRTTVYRFFLRYRDDPRVISLLPRRRGRAHGERFISPAVDEIIARHVKNRYLSKQGTTAAATIKDIRTDCDAEKLPLPDRKTVLRRIAAIDALERVAKREGRAKAAAMGAHPGGEPLVAAEPLEIVQIDHTLADIFVVEPETRLIIGRPYLTGVIDIHTRMACGLYVGFVAPSLTSVALCLTHAVMDKADWLTARGLEGSWPARGLPRVVHTDNASEFRSPHLARHLENYGTLMAFRDKGQPQHGGHVESLVRRLMAEVHNYPGTTYSNIDERGKSLPEKKACLTLRDLEYLISSYIIEYNHAFHTEIVTTPQVKWDTWVQETGGGRIRMPSDIREFYKDILPCERKKVRDHAIRMFNIKYWNSALIIYQNRQEYVDVHYDPRDISCVYVRGVSGLYIDVPYKNLKNPPLSLWEHRAVQAELRVQGRAAQDEAVIFAQVRARRQRIKEAMTSHKVGKRILKEISKGPSPERNEMVDRSQHPLVIEGAAVVIDVDDDTPLVLPTLKTEIL